MEKETRTYRFETEVIKHSENNPLIPSFAEWCSDRYRKEFMEVETISKKMQTYFDMGNACKEQLKKIKKETEEGADLSNLMQHELNWIKTEANKRLEKATFEGVYKFFINKFNRTDINRKQFRLMVKRMKTPNYDNNVTK